MSDKPAPTEYREYFTKYVALVPDGPIVDILAQQFERTLPFYRGISEEQAALRYAPGKWSVKQVMGHMADTERVFSYRALAFSRSDKNPLPSFEQNDYISAVDLDARPWRALVDDFATVRAASISLFRGMTPEMLLRKGTASGAEITVRALGSIIAGHEEYHVQAIRRDYLK
jgi:hypothetical protein